MKDSAKATDKQQRVLDYVRQQIKEEGYAPSVREICKALDCSFDDIMEVVEDD